MPLLLCSPKSIVFLHNVINGTLLKKQNQNISCLYQDLFCVRSHMKNRSNVIRSFIFTFAFRALACWAEDNGSEYQVSFWETKRLCCNCIKNCLCAINWGNMANYWNYRPYLGGEWWLPSSVPCKTYALNREKWIGDDR